MSSKLHKNHEWYQAHRDELVAKYRGRYIAIVGCDVTGDYGSEDEALCETAKVHPLGTFIVKKCVPQSEETPIVFHSRVAFA